MRSAIIVNGIIETSQKKKAWQSKNQPKKHGITKQKPATDSKILPQADNTW
jgi:hypothetical protein